MTLVFFRKLDKSTEAYARCRTFFEDEHEPPTVNGYPQTANCKLLTTSH